MARGIPVYQRQVLANGVQSAPNARSHVPTSDPVANALVTTASTLGGTTAALAAETKKVIDDRAAIDVANVLSQAEVYWQEDFKKRTDGYKVGEDLREGIGTDFDKWMGDAESKLPTDAARNYFRKQAIGMRTRMQTNAFTYQEKATTAKLDADTAVGIEADEAVVFGDPSRMDDVYRRRMEPMIARTDLTEAQKIEMAQKYKNRLQVAVNRGEIERDPAAWLAKRGVSAREDDANPTVPGAPAKPGGAAGFDAAVSAVLKHEGGYVAKDGNTGQPANFGINQKANPDIDVKNLTKDGARDVYRKRYWNEIGGDNLPADLQGTALDAAVNQGPANAKKWIEQSGGDVQKFNALRRAHYESLAAKPEYSRFRNTWMNRLATYENGAGRTAAPPGVSPEQYSALVTMAESKAKAVETRVFATVSTDAATQAVTAQDIGVSGLVDLSRAKSDAITNAQAKFGKPLDEGQRLQLEQTVDRLAGQREKERLRDQENTASSMFDVLDQNGGDLQAVRRDMADKLNTLPREAQDRLEKYAGQVATGETRPTDWIAYTQLVQDPKTLMATNLQALRDKFSNSDYVQLVTLQEKARKAQAAGTPDQTIQSDMAVVKSLLSTAGIKDDKKEAQFFSVLQREMDARRQATGQKELKQEEVKSIAADLLVREVTSKGILWDTKTPAFEIEVPPAERAKITAALTDRGLPVNESTILRAYRNKLNRSSTPATTAPATPAPRDPLFDQIPR